jgi:hypothetical protein
MDKNITNTAWSSDNLTFEAKRFLMYQYALQYDRINISNRKELAEFSTDNIYAEQYRRMLH